MPQLAGPWNNRFTHQAAWTERIRRFLLNRLEWRITTRVLEVGCGTGVITRELLDYAHLVYGLDLNLDFLKFSAQSGPGARLTGANALAMPFPTGTFDAVVCHFFLLWVPQPEQALAEMVRVTQPGGAVIAFAEPDYGGRVDYPPALEELGRGQTEALKNQGADPLTGRKLSELFHAAGLRQVETGIIGAQWSSPPSPQQQESEWQTLQQDLGERVSPAQLNTFREIDAQAWQTGQRVLFVPTFYAMGRKT